MMIRTFVIAAILAFVAGATVARADGAAVFAANCAKCHGTSGHADTPVAKPLGVPVLAGDAKVAGMTQDDLVALIKAQPKHASFVGKLSAEDLAAAAGQVKQLAAGK